MNEPIECYVCVRPGVLLDVATVQHDEGGVVRQCILPPRDVSHPDRLRTHGGARYAYAWKTS